MKTIGLEQMTNDRLLEVTLMATNGKEDNPSVAEYYEELYAECKQRRIIRKLNKLLSESRKAVK